jgi:hypothetical protein
MMLKVARALLIAAIPVEVLIASLLIAGVALPGRVIAVIEVTVLAALALEAAVAYRLFRTERSAGGTRRAAVQSTFCRMVPVAVRRLMELELKNITSLVLWVSRRRHDVPPGATAISYSRAQTSMLTMFLVVIVIEPAVLELLLWALGVPTSVRLILLAVGVYSVLTLLAVIAGGVTRPHVVMHDGLRIRYGAFFDLQIPRQLIADVRPVANYNEDATIKVEEERLVVAVASQTNLNIELTQPVTVVRPLGRRATVRTIRFFADDPQAAIRTLRSADRASVEANPR